MTYYENNIAVMKKSDPDLYTFIEQDKDSERETENNCFVQPTKDGSSIIGININDKSYYMGSRYNPTREAENFAKKYADIGDYSVVVFFGLGSGLIAKKIVELLGEHVQFLFYEPSIDIFLHAMNYYDLSFLIEHQRTRIVVQGWNDTQLDADLGYHITDENYRRCYFDSLPLYHQLFPDDYEMVKEKFSYAVNATYATITTKQRFAIKAVRNMIYNMKELFHSNCEMDFEGVFPTDRPVIIVAAGPSLEKNVEDLREVKGKFFMIAVDTALPYLMSKGIQPDLAITVDPGKKIDLFEDERTRTIPLAIYSSSNHDIVSLLHDQKIIFASAECSYYNKLYQIADKCMYSLPKGGSVATCAVTLAVEWGYKKIVLVGQDLALAPDKVHAGKENEIIYKPEDRIPIEGYYGDTVYTSLDYDYYRKWYELYLRCNTDIEMINATEGGAKIVGTIQKPLKEVIEEYPVEQFDFEGTIQKKPPTFDHRQQEEVVDLWKQSVDHLDELKKILYDSIKQTKYGIQLITGKYYKPSQMRSIQKKVRNNITKCNEYDEIYFLDCMIAKEQGDVLSDVFDMKEDNNEECCRMFEKLQAYMQAMYEVVDDVKGLFAEVIESTMEG